MAIKEWPLADRPREKLLLKGAKHLSDAELLAIFLRTGRRGKTAVEVAQDLILQFGSLKKLLMAEPAIVCKTTGIGKAKYTALKAALELGQRYHEEAVNIGETVLNSAHAKRYLIRQLSHHPHEVFACLFLDTHQLVLGFEELFRGTIDESNVYPREIVKRALAHNAAKVILAHNHPSGRLTPSQADLDVTQSLQQALALVDICVLDHIIVSHSGAFSFMEEGKLN